MAQSASYNNKKLSDHQPRSSTKNTLWSIARFFVVLLCIAGVIWVGKWSANAIKPIFENIATKTTKIVSQKIGEEPMYDDAGNLNVLLLGYGGFNHPGGFLTDSIMVASIHPKNGTITFVSVPRDLWVQSRTHRGKINSFFSSSMAYTGYNKDTINDSLHWSAKETAKKMEDITGLSIPYHAVVSFDGFKSFVDSIGGITVNVPQRLADPYYPGGTFVINSGEQKMNGSLALKYARSRKTTSDFSRAHRQQQIIKAFIASIKDSLSLGNVNGIKRMYNRYTDMVVTNLTFKNLLNLVQYKDNFDTYSSYVISNECGRSHKSMKPGCFLVSGNRSQFGGASVFVPGGARINDYSNINDFVYVVTQFPKISSEKGSLTIYNAINRSAAIKKRISTRGKIPSAASTLVANGFSVDDLFASPVKYERTTMYLQGEVSNYRDTIDALRSFMNVDIATGQALTGASPIQLYLGDNFLDDYTTNRFWK